MIKNGILLFLYSLLDTYIPLSVHIVAYDTKVANDFEVDFIFCGFQ